MLLTTNTKSPATDLDYLLHRRGNRSQSGPQQTLKKALVVPANPRRVAAQKEK